MPDLTPEQLAELKKAEPFLRALQEQRRHQRLKSMYRETGPYRRELYPKHLEYFKAGKDHRERLFLAANRVGKTWGVGAFELTLHLTGLYPDWWEGKRFTAPTKCWAAGDTSKTVREIIQAKLIGPPGDMGTGMIPADRLLRTTARAGLPDAVDTVWVRWGEDKRRRPSILTFKSYEMDRESFQGTEQDVIWLDEEPPMPIYTECLVRTMTTNGLVMLTFTPLMGMSEVVRQFLHQGSALN